MQGAVSHHGLNGLQVYPAGSIEDAEQVQTTRNFMGVTLTETELKASDNDAVAAAAAELCRQLFRNIVVSSAVLASVSGNLHRLPAEYRVTERRSRALESIILPEIDQALHEMSSHLEELDLEDAIRVRLQSKSPDDY
jgi:vacuolar-type H+-ATPase subunit D/Vma8